MDRQESNQEPVTPWEIEDHMEKKGKTAFQGPPPVKELEAAKAKLIQGLSPEEAREMAELLALMPPRPRTPAK